MSILKIKQLGTTWEMVASVMKDLVDVLLRIKDNAELQFPITNDHLKTVFFDIFLAGSESSSTMIICGASAYRAWRSTSPSSTSNKTHLKSLHKLGSNPHPIMGISKELLQSSNSIMEYGPCKVNFNERVRCRLSSLYVKLKLVVEYSLTNPPLAGASYSWNCYWGKPLPLVESSLASDSDPGFFNRQ
ncbi:hypothetical protein RND71_010044 [Anisodus tanguticus]|uniref:Uncharacterized protein n=1 Tax=Anisodus tanguticus TaxID=243964 RepID=A0AAE1VRT9_9SOLA|nr:hypothetical protein RND71_010044 [Anisodus tanguticus]